MRAMRLGTLLVRNAAIGLSQIEAALRNQVLYGGRLGTNLVELGYLDIELLSTYLADQSGVPAASPTLLEDADRPLLERLGSGDAHRFGAVPIGHLDRETAVVAMVDPSDGAAVDAVSEKLGTAVTPYIVPELRAAYYLEKHFGTPREARFLRVARSDSPAPGAEERRRTQPAGGIATPPVLTIEPRRRRPSATSVSQPVPTALMFGTARERIESATSREQIADTFANYAKGRCDTLVLFVPRERNAVGWQGYVAPPMQLGTPLAELSLPLGGSSALQVAHDTGQAYIGAPPSPATPVESRLWAALGANPPPTDVVVIPIVVKHQAVNLVYAHQAHGCLPDTIVAELQELAECAQATYLKLMRQRWES